MNTFLEKAHGLAHRLYKPVNQFTGLLVYKKIFAAVLLITLIAVA